MAVGAVCLAALLLQPSALSASEKAALIVHMNKRMLVKEFSMRSKAEQRQLSIVIMGDSGWITIRDGGKTLVDTPVSVTRNEYNKYGSTGFLIINGQATLKGKTVPVVLTARSYRNGVGGVYLMLGTFGRDWKHFYRVNTGGRTVHITPMP
jgi:hypothetical protein